MAQQDFTPAQYREAVTADRKLYERIRSALMVRLTDPEQGDMGEQAAYEWASAATTDVLRLVVEPLTLKTEDGWFAKVRRLMDPYDIDAAMEEHRAIYIMDGSND
jgi:hypothetical protein